MKRGGFFTSPEGLPGSDARPVCAVLCFLLLSMCVAGGGGEELPERAQALRTGRENYLVFTLGVLWREYLNSLLLGPQQPNGCFVLCFVLFRGERGEKGGAGNHYLHVADLKRSIIPIPASTFCCHLEVT